MAHVCFIVIGVGDLIKQCADCRAVNALAESERDGIDSDTPAEFAVEDEAGVDKFSLRAGVMDDALIYGDDVAVRQLCKAAAPDFRASWPCC